MSSGARLYSAEPSYASAPATYASAPCSPGGVSLTTQPVTVVEEVIRPVSPAPVFMAAQPVREIIEVVRDESEIMALRGEVAALRQALGERDMQLGECQRKNMELMQALGGEVAALRQALGERDMQLGECQRKNMELMQANAQLEGLVAEYKAIMDQQAARIAELERLVDDLQRPAEAPAPEPPAQKMKGLSDADKIDRRIMEYLRNHPDFPVVVDKIKPSWYSFKQPIDKKMYFKVVGEQVLAHVGGGYAECWKWLDEERHMFLEAEGMEEKMNRPDKPAAKPAAKRRAPGGRGAGFKH